MKKSLLLKGLIYSIISASAFASLVIFVKLGYKSGFSVKDMLVYRFVSGSFFMFVFLLLFKPSGLKITVNLTKKTLVTGAFLYTAQSFCFFSSVKYVAPSVTELLLYLYPAFVTLLAAFIYKEKITPFKALYVGIVVVGFLFIFKDALHSRIEITGVVLGVSAMVIYSVYLIVIQRFLKYENPISLTFYTIVFAALSFSIIFGIPKELPNMRQFLIIIALGLVTTVISIGFLFAAIELIGSSLTSIFSSFEPVITIILSLLILHTGMNEYQAIGAVFILTGVFMANIYHLKTSGQ